MSETGRTVCVTGASGYIASWIVKFLLQRGYVVKACVRDPSDQAKTDHLLALDGAKERLHLVKADLLEEGSYDSAVEGCDGVFHVASPCYFDPKDPKVELLDPAVKGTLNVLRSCAKTPSVKRVVLTSSIAAVVRNGKPRTAGVVVDESWFSDPKLCEELKLWYNLSKTLAEEAAWKFVKENNVDMVVINPSMVIGPLLQPKLNASCGLILDLMNGKQEVFENTMVWVDVRDVANAHIQAFEIPSANGRYCVVERVARGSDLVKMLGQGYPTLQLHHKFDYEKPFEPTYQVSKVKSKELGIEYIPLEMSLKETLDSLKEKQFLNF